METLKLDLQNVMDYLDSKVHDEELHNALVSLNVQELGANLNAVSALLSFKNDVQRMVTAYNVLKSMC